MTTSLSAQLRALSTVQARDKSFVAGKPRTRPSLLFDPREAADIDLQAIFALAQSGLEELQIIDEKFVSYKESSLFGAASTRRDREQQTQKCNDILNQSLAPFLHLLSKYILLPPAQQVFEYLIRHYKVHVYNVDDVMSSILPFHETSVFVRIVQLLKLQKTKWEFFIKLQESGAPAPREGLVQRCTHDFAFLEAVCDTGLMGSKPDVNSRTHIRFSIVTVMEALSRVPLVTKDILTKVIPFLLHSLNNRVTDEYQVGGLMMVGLLTTRATLTNKLCVTLLKSLFKNSHSQHSRLSLMVIIQIFQTQEVDCFPPKTLRNILRVKDLSLLLTEISKSFNSDKFICSFIIAVAENCFSSQFFENALFRMIADFPLGNHIKHLISKLLGAGLNKEAEDASFSAKALFEKALSLIEKRFPSALDCAVKSFFEEKNEPFIKVLDDVLKNSLRQPMEVAACSLLESIDHVKPDVRKSAVQHISEMSLRGEVAPTIGEVFLRRLSDSDLAVVRTVLSVDRVEEIIPQDKILKPLCSLIHRCMDILEIGPKPLKEDAKAVVNMCFKLLEPCFIEQSNSILKEIQLCLLCYIIVKPKTWKQNLEALKVSSKCRLLLFRSLPSEIPNRPEERTLKDAWRKDLNDKILTSLAMALLEDHNLVDLLLDAAVISDSAKVLSLLILQKCFLAKRDGGTLEELCEKCMPFLRDEWIASGAGNCDLESIDYDSFSGADVCFRLGKGELILLVLYRMIPSLVSSRVLHSVYLLFSEFETWKVFKPHLLKFFGFLSHRAVTFVFECSMAEDAPPPVQVHALSILTWYFKQGAPLEDQELNLAAVGSIVTLASSLKSARAAAVRCLKAITQKVHISSGILELLQAILYAKKNFVNDGRYMSSFLSTFFDESKFDQKQLESIVQFLIENALKLPLAAQIVFFEALRAVRYTPAKASAVKNNLLQLLHKRSYHLKAGPPSSQVPLTPLEINIVDCLLEINLENLSKLPSGQEDLSTLFDALYIGRGSLLDPGVVRPCLAALRFLSPMIYNGLSSGLQDKIFETLIELAAVTDSAIRPAAQHVLDSLQINVLTVSKHVAFLHSKDAFTDSERAKKTKVLDNSQSWPGEAEVLKVSVALLEFLLRKTKDSAWGGLLNSLFGLLRAHLERKWPKSQSEIPEGDFQHVGQLVLNVIENVIRSKPEEHASDLDVDLLIEYLKSATNDVTRNHVFSVITAAGNISPERVLPHVVEIVTIAGASTMTEDVSHFHTVVQQMLCSVVPFWLKQTHDPRSLLQVFLEALPAVPQHRQTDLVKCILRVTDEERSISAFLRLLLSKHEKQWPISFADRLCISYDSGTRIAALVKLSTEFQLEMFQTKDKSFWSTLERVTFFIAKQLQRLEVHLLDDAVIQDASRTLMEHALQQLQVLSDTKIKALSETKASCLDAAHLFLDSVTKLTSPSIFCKTVAFLLQNADNGIRRKVLQIYVSKLKERDATPKKKRGGTENLEAHMEIVAQIAKLLLEHDLSPQTKQVAVSSLDVAVQKFGEGCASAFVSCLPAVLKAFEEENRAIVVASVRCTASILSTAGPETLPSLPALMNSLLKIPHQCTTTEGDNGADLEIAVALALEAAVDKLGAFLSPYIQDIVHVVISSKLNDSADPNLSSTFNSARTLISEKLPARLLLDPLINAFKVAVEDSEVSTAFIFQMVAAMCSKLDRASVTAYHTKIFEFCKEALDLRRKLPKSFSSVYMVEENVISAITSLVMKLSETTFRPLFVSIQQWAASTAFDGGQSIERNIVFYKLVNQLSNKLRSVFVPYFRYLFDGCLATLGTSTETRKTKKRKTADVSADEGPALAKWQLKHLVISALHKCFLHDNIGFLDAPKFQQLLPPLADQLLEEPPPELQGVTDKDVPTLADADEALVSCLGRMGLAAGTDVLWKPLNHDVLMKTRSSSVRAKRLALDVVKFLAENLREEYLVLIPETIPFLSELLEDQHLAIVAQTQELIKFLEELSGESLAQYM